MYPQTREDTEMLLITACYLQSWTTHQSEEKEITLLLTGQEHAWLSCRPRLHDLPQPATTQPARAEAAG